MGAEAQHRLDHPVGFEVLAPLSLRDMHVWRRAHALACCTPDSLRLSRHVLDWLRVPFIGPSELGCVQHGHHCLHQWRVEYEVDEENPMVRYMLDGFSSDESYSESDASSECSGG